MFSIPTGGQSVLCVLVLNGFGSQGLRRSRKLLSRLRNHYPAIWQTPGCSQLSLHCSQPLWKRAILAVDCCTQGRLLSPEHGTGLARKIGADIACRLIDVGAVKHPFIHCTDADVVLPVGYFDVQPAPEDVALVYPFELWCAGDSSAQRVQLMQMYKLHYERSGLDWARSPYTFHTAARALAVDSGDYAAAGGFPKIADNEAFYLLNELSKLGRVRSLSSPTLGVHQNGDSMGPLEEPRFLHPQVFFYLKTWLKQMSEFWGKRKTFCQLGFGRILTRGLAYERASGLSAEILQKVLESMGAEQAVRHGLERARTREEFLKSLHTWFDAAKTRRFLNLLSCSYYPSVSLPQTLLRAPFTPKLSQNWGHGIDPLQTAVAAFREREILQAIKAES
ncbi:MAG: hypothetical protein JW937_06580 [Candidatus Omnitrophica bacterium]|nr:hypothetical protein [Candidatus Omnitrophota bacterium]